ncbi:MAG: DUF2142 domain-containing protein [Gemmiger sp.]|nr:DUF2142 domain-containing protein [Gemmiger sp.]
MKQQPFFKRPTAPQPAARWVFACIAAALLGVAWAYYWRVFYYLDTRLSPLLITGVCVAGAVGAVLAALLVRRAMGFATKGALCIALCGVLFVFANPPMQAPDESVYYLRAYSISQGHFDFDATRTYPDDVAALTNALPGAWVNAHTSQGLRTDPDTGEVTAYSNAGYALKQYGEDGPVQGLADSFGAYFSRADTTPVTEPVSFLILPFLPQALGMVVARLLGLGALGCLYGGRLGNLAVYLLLCWLALKKAERYRPVLLCVMLLPLSLFMGASLSYDAYLLGCYYLMLALLTRRRWDTQTMLLYAIACVGVNIAKPYLNLLWVLLPLCLPKARFCAKGRRWAWGLAMLAGCLAATGLVEWYGTVFRYHYDVIARMGGEDVNQLAQLRFVLANPLRYLAVLVGTLYENDFFIGQLGLFGWKDMPIALLNTTGPLALLAAAVLGGAVGTAHPRENAPTLAAPAKRQGLWLLLFCLVYAVGAMTAMYITYTPVTMVRIVGLQARYFLPVFCLAAMVLAGALARRLAPALSPQRAERYALLLFAPHAALGALLLAQHYWIGPIYTI